MTDKSAGDGAPIRDLTAMEEFAWTWSFKDSINASMTAHVAGRTTVEGWRRALDRVQARHALLSASVEAPDTNPARDGHPWFRRQPGSPIPLRVVPWTAATRWEDELERELAHPFLWGDHPLIRATLIHREDRCILVLTASHAIIDGLSYLFVVRDLLSVLAGDAIAPPPAPGSAEQALGLAPIPRPPLPAERIAAGEVVRRAGVPAVETHTVGADAMSGVVEACRRRDCTFNGALVAATGQAMRRLMPEWRDEPIRVLVPVNIRDVVEAGEGCGAYATMAGVTLAAAPSVPFWDAAGMVRTSARAASSREAFSSLVEGLRGLFSNGMTPGELAKASEGDAGREIIVTNLGRAPYGGAFGSLELVALHPAVPNILPPFHTVAAVTLEGSLFLTFVSRSPVPGFLEEVIAVLTENCGP